MTTSTRRHSTAVPSLLINEEVEIPMGLGTLEAFTRWSRSAAFPQPWRIDFLRGQVVVDMSPEEAFTHGSPKVEITRVLANLLREVDLGVLCADRMRVASPAAGLSAEPDVVFVSHEALESGRVRRIAGRTAQRDSCIEFEGGPALVVEVVSRSSLKKDTNTLPPLYFASGVREYWLVNALESELVFQIQVRSRTGFRRLRPDAAGFLKSAVFARSFRMTTSRTPRGYPTFELLVA